MLREMRPANSLKDGAMGMDIVSDIPSLTSPLEDCLFLRECDFLRFEQHVVRLFVPSRERMSMVSRMLLDIGRAASSVVLLDVGELHLHS